MPETVHQCATIEQARNEAIAWLEQKGVQFGPHRKIEIGRLGLLTGHEIGVSSGGGTPWRLRLDYDPMKGAHFNVEYDKGPGREKAAFCFPGGEKLIEKLASSRVPR